MAKTIEIEIVYANPHQQRLLIVQVVQGTTISEAIQQSGMLQLFPEINLATQKVGIFSEPKQLTDPVQAGERIEIYRPLTIDPKESRRKRAELQDKPKE